jgi:hypothetical protein
MRPATAGMKKLIAPCGMNCGLCIAHLRDRNRCPGCRMDNGSKSVTRRNCKIKNCAVFRGGTRFCFQCKEYPCPVLERLDRRYREKYGMSMIENLNNIKKNGIRKFIAGEKKWIKGDKIFCVHDKKYHELKQLK